MGLEGVTGSVRLLFDEPDCSGEDRFLDADALPTRALEDAGVDGGLTMPDCLLEDVAVLVALIFAI